MAVGLGVGVGLAFGSGVAEGVGVGVGGKENLTTPRKVAKADVPEFPALAIVRVLVPAASGRAW